MPPRSFQTPNALDVARASAHADASGNGVAFASAFASSGPEETTQNLFSSIPFTTFRPSPESSTSQAVQLSSFVEPQTTTALARMYNLVRISQVESLTVSISNHC